MDEHFSIFEIEEKKDNDDMVVEYKKIKELDCSTVYNSVYFPKPHNKILSCSFNKHISIFDGTTFKVIKRIRAANSLLLHIMKWSESIFLVADNDKYIQSFSIIPPFKLLQKKKFPPDKGPSRILKLDEERMAVRSPLHTISILRYEKFETLKKYRCEYINYVSFFHFYKSLYYENSFYIPIQDKDLTIRLINYETDMVLKEFKGHKKDEYIMAFSICKNSRGEEILICCTKANMIYYYNTTSPKFEADYSITSMKRSAEKNEIMAKKGHVYVSYVFKNQYLLIGDNLGDFSLFHISLENKKKKLIKKFESKKVKSIFCDVQLLSESENEVKFIFSHTATPGISIVSIKGLRFFHHEKQSLEDRNERISFLRENKDEFIMMELEKKMLVSIGFVNFKFEKCLRVLFC